MVATVRKIVRKGSKLTQENERWNSERVCAVSESAVDADKQVCPSQGGQLAVEPSRRGRGTYLGKSRSNDLFFSQFDDLPSVGRGSTAEAGRRLGVPAAFLVATEKMHGQPFFLLRPGIQGLEPLLLEYGKAWQIVRGRIASGPGVRREQAPAFAVVVVGRDSRGALLHSQAGPAAPVRIKEQLDHDDRRGQTGSGNPPCGEAGLDENLIYVWISMKQEGIVRSANPGDPGLCTKLDLQVACNRGAGDNVAQPFQPAYDHGLKSLIQRPAAPLPQCRITARQALAQIGETRRGMYSRAYKCIEALPC